MFYTVMLIMILTILLMVIGACIRTAGRYDEQSFGLRRRRANRCHVIRNRYSSGRIRTAK